MNDDSFKMEVVQRLTVIETLLKERPACKQVLIFDKIMNDRKAIGFLYALYLGMIGKVLWG